MKAQLPVITALLLALLVCPAGVTAKQDEQAPGREMAKQAIKEKKLWITADHSKFEILQQKFKSGPEVTEVCLSCHTEAARQFHKTIHWTWMEPISLKDEKLGKGGLSINNF